MIKINGIQPLMCFDTDGLTQFDTKYLPHGSDIVLITTPNSRLIPFTWKHEGYPIASINYVYLVNYNSGVDYDSRDKIDILGRISDITFDTDSEGDSYLMNYGQSDLTADMPSGVYYLKVEYSDVFSGDFEFYTDVFSIGNVEKMIKLEYYHSVDTDDFIFQNNYKNIFYLPVYIQDNYDPDIEQESVLDNRNDETRYFQREYEKFRLSSFIAHRNTAKMFTHMSFMDNCTITTQHGETASIENIDLEFKHQEGTEYTEINLIFKLESFILDNNLQNKTLTTRTLLMEDGNVILLENGNDLLQG